jgi:hypothetical protein
MARCTACHAPILWTVTEAGRRLPVDAEELERGITSALDVDDGNVIPTGDTAGPDSTVPVVYVTGHLIEAAQLFPPARRWRPHFATCPEADRFRRRTPKATNGAPTPPPSPYGRGDSIITPRHP